MHTLEADERKFEEPTHLLGPVQVSVFEVEVAQFATVTAPVHVFGNKAAKFWQSVMASV